MAFDEAMLLGCAELGGPVLRFYSWTERAASFGYFQRYAEIESATGLRPLVRRCTGGGLVPHDSDWTYSLAFPPSHERYRLRAEEGYRRLHEAVSRALRVLGAKSHVADECDACGSGRCFVGHERHDVVGPEGKIAGAAQRRTRAGLLVQGSLRPPAGIGRREWELAFQRELGIGRHRAEESVPAFAPLRSVAERLVVEKYSRESFLKRR